MSDQEILDKINALKTNYYANNNKNLMFKKQQKFELASNIMQTMDMNTVLGTIIRVENSMMHFNYAVFKTVASPEIYMNIVQYIFAKSDELVQNYGTFQVTIDIKGLTMTGVERYKGFVSLLSQQGAVEGLNFLVHIDKMYVVNPPSMMMNIAKILLPLVDPSVKDKIVLANET
jgi:hypothetical protein